MTRAPKTPRLLAKRVVLLPGVAALLPEYASLVDPVRDLRQACEQVVAWLAELDVPIAVHCSRANLRLADYVIAEAGALAQHRVQPPLEESIEATLVIGNGSACRSEKAPGYLDERSHAFDASIDAALRLPDPGVLAAVDRELGNELLADVGSIAWLGAEVLTPQHRAEVTYDDDPFGVQYWVAKWEFSR